MNIDEDHATTKAIRQTKAFTVSLANRDHIDVADYYGIATGNKIPDKFARSGYYVIKSARVPALVITEFPIALECGLAEITEIENLYARLLCGYKESGPGMECGKRDFESGTGKRLMVPNNLYRRTKEYEGFPITK